MADIRCLEHPTLKVPYEMLNKRFRSAQKSLEREASHVAAAIADLEKSLQVAPENKSALYASQINIIMERLTQMQNRLEEVTTAEMAATAAIKNRLEHLSMGAVTGHRSAAAISPPGAHLWRKTRIDRMLVEHFLRSGFYDSAVKLAQVASVDNLTNIGLFLVAREVEDALAARDTSKCLAWCHDNKSRMRKVKSSLEFNIRLQEFIELVRANRKKDAVQHARKYLANADTDQLPVVQKAMAMLAFSSNTPVYPYNELFSEERWGKLVEQFRLENYRLYQLCNQSVFTVSLQAGLSALKTQHCYRPISDQHNTECPVCQSPLNELGLYLPFAHCSQSRLICFISGKPLNEHNHPLMLPNGFVYGEEALVKMATENDGQIVCPRTREIFSIKDAEKIYVM